MVAEAITAGILANATYDLLKISGSISYKGLKHLLLGREVSDLAIEELNTELNKLPLDDSMTEEGVKKVVLASEEIIQLLATLQPSKTSTTIKQTNVYGDNVGIQHNH